MKSEFIEIAGRGQGYDGASGRLKINIISPGPNKAKTRLYPAAVLKRDAAAFRGAHMNLDHPTKAEAAARPEGSVRSWVGTVTAVSVAENGDVKGEATIFDAPLKAKLAAMKNAGVLNSMGISIRASGAATRQKVDGVGDIDVIESIDQCHSIDFVTYPGANGRVEELLESATDRDRVDSISKLEEFKRSQFESYKKMGLSEAEARIAAGIEDRVLKEEDVFAAYLQGL